MLFLRTTAVLQRSIPSSMCYCTSAGYSVGLNSDIKRQSSLLVHSMQICKSTGGSVGLAPYSTEVIAFHRVAPAVACNPAFGLVAWHPWPCAQQQWWLAGLLPIYTFTPWEHAVLHPTWVPGGLSLKRQGVTVRQPLPSVQL